MRQAKQAARLGLLHGFGSWRYVGLPLSYGDGGQNIFLYELDDSKGFAVVYREPGRAMWNFFGVKAGSKSSGASPSFTEAEEAMADAERWLKSKY
jgi:hypothetical protein